MNGHQSKPFELEAAWGDNTGDLDLWQTLCKRRSGSTHCPRCSKQVDLMNFADAARCFNTDEQDIEYLAKTGEVHRLHNSRGEMMVCCNSLFACFDSRPTRLLDSHFEEAMRRSGKF